MQILFSTCFFFFFFFFLKQRSELQRLSDLLSFEGFRCSVDKPGRQFSMCMPFRVRVIYPGDKESKKWKNWEAWLLSDLIVFGEREKTKTQDHLTVKAWFPLEQVNVDMEDVESGVLSNPSTARGPETTRQSRRIVKVGQD